MIMNRTNPAAGKEYKWFKQAEYYDKMGYAHGKVQNDVKQMFEGVQAKDLDEMSFMLEDVVKNPAVMREFIQKLAQRDGPVYADTVEKSIAAYFKEMDEIVIDEVNRGFFRYRKAEWQPHEMQLFEQLVSA